MAKRAPSPVPAADRDPTHLLSLDGVAKAYRSQRESTPVLTDVDLVLRRGEITCLVGPSGSGKSTIVALIAGLLVPDAGRVLFDGQDLGTMSDAKRARLRARKIGIVLQSGNLVPFLTAAENVALAARFAGGHPAGRACTSCSSRWESRPARITCPAAFPGARPSASPWPSPW